MPHIQTIIEHRGESMSDTGAPPRLACVVCMRVSVYVYQSLCRFVFWFVCARILLVWECDRQNETSQRKLLGRQSIMLGKVCSYNPLFPCVLRDSVCACVHMCACMGWGQGEGQHSQKPRWCRPLLSLFLMLDKIMSLYSTPENNLPWLYYPGVSFQPRR